MVVFLGTFALAFWLGGLTSSEVMPTGVSGRVVLSEAPEEISIKEDQTSINCLDTNAVQSFLEALRYSSENNQDMSQYFSEDLIQELAQETYGPTTPAEAAASYLDWRDREIYEQLGKDIVVVENLEPRPYCGAYVWISAENIIEYSFPEQGLVYGLNLVAVGDSFQIDRLQVK